MKIFIIDTNIIFSAILFPKSRIGQFIVENAGSIIRLYAPTYLMAEINALIPKLMERSGLSEAEITLAIRDLYRYIRFVPDSEIPISAFLVAAPLIRDIDPKDIAFVALTEHLDELLWTGDKKLEEGLKAKGYQKVLNFQEVRAIINE